MLARCFFGAAQRSPGEKGSGEGRSQPLEYATAQVTGDATSTVVGLPLALVAWLLARSSRFMPLVLTLPS